MRVVSHVKLLVLGAMVGTCNGYGWDRFMSTETSTSENNNELQSHGFDPAEILQAGVKKSLIFTKAVGLLQSLEHSPSCYRTAARVLVNSCQRLEQSWHPGSQRNNDPEKELMDHKYSYALSLAVCDLSVAKKDIDKSCDPFREESLKQLPVHDKGFPLQISHDAVSACMKALTNDGVSWTSFSGNKEQAFTICQASREDMEKDEILETYRKTGKVVESFGELMELQLEQWKNELEARNSANKLFFEGLLKQMTNAKDEVVSVMHNIIQGISRPAEDVKDTLHAASHQATQVQHELDKVFESIRLQHSQHVVAQRAASSAQADLAANIQSTSNQLEVMQSVAELVQLQYAAFYAAFREQFTSLEDRLLLVQQASIQAAMAANNATADSFVASRLSRETVEHIKLVAIGISDVAEDIESIKDNMSSLMDGLMTISRVISILPSPTVLGTLWWIPATASPIIWMAGHFGMEVSIAHKILSTASVILAPVAYNRLTSWIWLYRTSPLKHRQESTIVTDPISLRDYAIEAIK